MYSQFVEAIDVPPMQDTTPAWSYEWRFTPEFEDDDDGCSVYVGMNVEVNELRNGMYSRQVALVNGGYEHVHIENAMVVGKHLVDELTKNLTKELAR